LKNSQSLARQVLRQEADAILAIIEKIDDTFDQCVEHLLQAQGRLVVTGIGKSAIIAQKIVATLNSTGTPAIFMHAADAIHGDLGMIQPGDTVLCLSKSGDTPEIKVLVPLLKRTGNKLIALVSNTQSYLAQQADFVLNGYVAREACPLNLAPTTSTTVALALGDALAMALLEHRGFNSQDFAKFHPGGALGKKLYLKVLDLYPKHALPQVEESASLKEVILEMTTKRLGATAVLRPDGTLAGIITDGDLRRMLKQHSDLDTLQAGHIMSRQPITVAPETYASEALHLMQQRNITQVIVVDDGRPLGFVHLHDLLQEGIV
jgi:arabinose-5-phosphate isomerase